MSDFDAVLELLLTDPSFQARLAADPVGTLAGYDLDAAEADLLRQQVSSDPGAQSATVENRVTKSSTFGLFGSLGIGGAGDAVGGAMARQGFGEAPVDNSGGLGMAAGSAARAAVEHSPTEGFGSAPEAWGTGGGDFSARTGFGSAPGAWGTGGGDFSARTGFGAAPEPAGGHDPGVPPATSGLGDAPNTGLGNRGDAYLAPPKGYHNQVDADGDGHMDRATYRGRVGGGAEIRVDLNHDGRADFIGVDEDLDNRVDFADYDKNHDGVFEKRMFDDDGDGYLDRTVRRQHPGS
jgi:hypothetical protein